MKVLEAAKIAKQRFNRDAWKGYHGNGWRTDRAGWRKIVSNVQKILS